LVKSVLFVSEEQSFGLDSVGLGPLYTGEDFEKKTAYSLSKTDWQLHYH